MTRLRAAVRRVAGMLFPWPSKGEREAAIASARAEKERSQVAAAHAEDISRQIRRAQEENSFARTIAAAFRGEGGPAR